MNVVVRVSLTICLGLCSGLEASAESGTTCAKIRIKRVELPDDCVARNESCFVEFEAGDGPKHFRFRSESDGSEESFGFSRRCTGLSRRAEDRPLSLPPGCTVSIDFGGPAGAAGAKCVCARSACHAEGAG